MCVYVRARVVLIICYERKGLNARAAMQELQCSPLLPSCDDDTTYHAQWLATMQVWWQLDSDMHLCWVLGKCSRPCWLCAADYEPVAQCLEQEERRSGGWCLKRHTHGHRVYQHRRTGVVKRQLVNSRRAVQHRLRALGLQAKQRRMRLREDARVEQQYYC